MKLGITGASGCVGDAVSAAAMLAGHEVVALGRRPTDAGEWRRFALESPEIPNVLGLDAVVHCAHDSTAIADGIEAVNLGGARRLLAACRRADVPVVLLSSLSAGDALGSSFGRTKLSLEGIVLRQGGAAVRAGAVVGPGARGIVGELADAVRSRPVVWLPASRRQQVHVTHVDALAAELLDLAAGKRWGALVLGAHPVRATLGDLVGGIAASARRAVRIADVPWRVAYSGLRALETVGRPRRFHSDDLLALVHTASDKQLRCLDAGCADHLSFAALRDEHRLVEPAHDRVDFTSPSEVESTPRSSTSFADVFAVARR